MAYEFFYPGMNYALEPTYGEFIGYRIPLSRLGTAPANVQTANQIQEVTNLLNQGIKQIEVGPIQPEIFEQIPKQHLKEINRINKLTGSDTSVHAPMIDPAGFTQQGWTESTRDQAENQIKSIVERSHELSPEGNIPVTIHASGIPGTEWIPGKEGKPEVKRVIVINQETKEFAPLEVEEKFYPGEGKIIMKPDEMITSVNNDQWISSITNLAFYKKEADETINRAESDLRPLLRTLMSKGIKVDREFIENLPPDLQRAYSDLQRGDLFLRNVETNFRSLYNRASKYAIDERSKHVLNSISNDWKEANKEIEEKGDIMTRPILKSRLLDATLEKLKAVRPPEVFTPVEKFAEKQASATIGNVAFDAYKKFGENAPVVSLENWQPGAAFARADEMKKLIEASRKKFVENAVAKGYSKSEAEKNAEKLIGATWDIGHINMMRKSGFKKDIIIEETKKIAPYVKHVHLSDNFGFSDSHLPPGMGEVPTKEMLEALEKAGFEGKTIAEIGGYVAQFRTSPMKYMLESFGSPIYAMMQQPYWNQTPSMPGYFSGYGPFLPETHLSTYGAGFSGMPTELGGQIPGKQSRFAGTPTE